LFLFRMNVLLTGASGLIGSQVANALGARNDRVISVTRGSSQADQSIIWNPLDKYPSDALVNAVEQSDAIIHLAGENIAGGRWTRKRKDAIRESRIRGTRQIVAAINAARRKPRAFLSASAIGFYGDRGDEMLDESSSPASAWLSELCREWETSAAQANARIVHLRFGIILSKSGGALPRMMRPFRFGLGGPVGSGNQWMSWIEIGDAVRAILHLLDHSTETGPVNIVAPNPLTNENFSRVLGRVLHRPALFRVPAPVLRLMLGEMADELVLFSQRVRPEALGRSCFDFQYPTIDSALRQLLLSGAES
jgi:uncharacterized protein (TIGR01777 family)